MKTTEEHRQDQENQQCAGSERINVVLELRGSGRKRKKARWMMLKTLDAMRGSGAEVCGTYTEYTAKRIRSFQLGNQ